MKNRTSIRNAVRDIYRNGAMSIGEKYAAWREAAETMPDEEIEVTDYETGTAETTGVKALLRNFISEGEKLEKQFFSNEPETVYLTETENVRGGEPVPLREPALTWEDCVKNLKGYRDCEELAGICKVYVTKFYPKQTVNGFMKEITVSFGELGEITDVGSRMLMTVPEYRDLVWKMESI